MAANSVPGLADNLSLEVQLSGLTIQTADDTVHRATDLVEASSLEQFRNVIGQHVFKRFAELMCDGVIERYDNVSGMFKVVYTNGHSEEMTWDDLMKYLVPQELPLLLYTNELANKDHETGEGLAQVAPAPPFQRHGCTKKMYSRTKRKEVANIVCPPRQAGRKESRCPTRDKEAFEMVLRHSTRKKEISQGMNLRRSTRKRRELGYSYREETTDEDMGMDEDEPDYPLPHIIQVPWADKEDEDPPQGPMRGLCTSKGRKGKAKKHWVSLRISASTYHRDGQKKVPGRSNDQRTEKQ